MDRAIDSLERLVIQQTSDGPTSAAQTLPLAQSILAMKPLQPYTPVSANLTFMDANLNDSQKEAVQFALDSPEIALVCKSQSLGVLVNSWITPTDTWPTRGELLIPICPLVA
jgi:hypothetical protein